MNQPQRYEQKEKDLENVYHVFTHTYTHTTHTHTHTHTPHKHHTHAHTPPHTFTRTIHLHLMVEEFLFVCVCVSGVFLHVCLYAWRMFFNISTCYGLGLSTVEIKYQNIKIHDLKEG